MNPAGLDTSACMGMTLTISDISLHTPAWHMLDLISLWELAQVRGSDRDVPGIEGVIAYPRRPTATTHSLPMVIVGGVDYTGAPYIGSNPPWDGLEANISYLNSNVVAPPGGDGTRAASLLMPSGTTRTARVTVLHLSIGNHIQAGMLATLDISIPTGAFT